MKLRKHFYESSSRMSPYMIVEAEYTPKATFDDEPSVEIVGIYVIKDKTATDISGIFNSKFPSFVDSLVEDIDWDEEYYLEQYETID
jgi:hypothetical protein